MMIEFLAPTVNVNLLQSLQRDTYQHVKIQGINLNLLHVESPTLMRPNKEIVLQPHLRNKDSHSRNRMILIMMILMLWDLIQQTKLK